MRRTVSDVVSWVRGISQSYFWWDATLKSHHESDLWFLGILQLLLGNRWCFATIPLHSLCLWCLSLPSSLRSLGAALRAALGVVLPWHSCQTPSWLESIARLCINIQLYPNFTQRTALQEALSATVLTLSSIAVALLHLRKPGKLRIFKQSLGHLMFLNMLLLFLDLLNIKCLLSLNTCKWIDLTWCEIQFWTLTRKLHPSWPFQPCCKTSGGPENIQAWNGKVSISWLMSKMREWFWQEKYTLLHVVTLVYHNKNKKLFRSKLVHFSLCPCLIALVIFAIAFLDLGLQGRNAPCTSSHLNYEAMGQDGPFNLKCWYLPLFM